MDYHYYDEADYMEDDGGTDDLYQDIEPPAMRGNAHIAHSTPMERIWDSYENCMLPSVVQVCSYLLPMLLSCLLCRLLTMLYVRRQALVVSWPAANGLAVLPLHLLNIVGGLVVLYATLGQLMWVLLLTSVVSYVLLQLVRVGKDQRSAVAIAVLCIGSTFVYELVIWRDRDDWPLLRGLQMITNMKVISLGYDLTASELPAQRMPSIVAYLGYICNPANCVMGPWQSYARYLDTCCNKPQLRRSLCQMLLNLLLCLLALSISNCVAPALGELQLQDNERTTHAGFISHWLVMYTGALSVRSSHYFICFSSQALLAADGQLLDTPPQGKSAQLGELVTRPWDIEWPHSISVLVRSWNMPTHEWLKRYVYGAAKQRSRHQTIVAVFCTYLISALMHGMDYRIYLVLLSLAIFAQGETMLRRHLATLFNACVAANPCPGAERCRYTRCPQRRGWHCLSSWLVKLTNLAFTLLAIMHLAYLGVMLLNETLTSETENELPFVYHWAAAGYLSHYIGIGMFVLYLFIS